MQPGSPVRQATFTAALEQAEQLFRAAEGAGVMTRPISLYYGLNQAGRAIAAAAVNVPTRVQTPGQNAEPWKLSGHGIHVPGISAGTAGGVLASVPVCDQGLGAFTQLADILGSASLPVKTPSGDATQKVTVAELWETLPDTFGFNLATRAEFPVLGFRDTSHRAVPRFVQTASGEIEGIPAHIYESNDQATALKEFLAHYPTVGNWGLAPGVPLATQWSQSPVTGMHVVKLAWAQPTAPSSVSSPSLEQQVATPYFRDWYIFPGLRENSKPLHPLLAWWAILYVLSMVARYEPYVWVKMTNIDSSVEASSIEHLLESALARLPRLIVDTIDEVSAR